MTKRQISEHFAIDFGTNNPAWRDMRNSAGVDSYLEGVGEEAVARCNADLRAAQAKRKQPVEDGYDYTITHGSRSRLNIFPVTPRAMAHEAVNQTILKSIPVGDVKGSPRSPDHDIPSELAERSNAAQGRVTKRGAAEAERAAAEAKRAATREKRAAAKRRREDEQYYKNLHDELEYLEGGD